MTDREQRLLRAVVLMTLQYLSTDGPESDLDSLSMSAGETALNVLAEHGLLTITAAGRCGEWTEAGLQFLSST